MYSRKIAHFKHTYPSLGSFGFNATIPNTSERSVIKSSININQMKWEDFMMFLSKNSFFPKINIQLFENDQQNSNFEHHVIIAIAISLFLLLHSYDTLIWYVMHCISAEYSILTQWSKNVPSIVLLILFDIVFLTRDISGLAVKGLTTY